MTTERIDGSALRFFSVGETEQPDRIVLLLHGSGSYGENLMPLATHLAAHFPMALFVMPNAPQSYADILPAHEIAAANAARPGFDWEQSRTWMRPPEEDGDTENAQRDAFFAALMPPVRALNRFVDLLLARHQLSSDALHMYGFSHGGMMALHLAIDRPQECASVICHSGHFLGAPIVRSRPRTLLIFGAEELAPNQMMSQVHPVTITALREIELPFTEHVAEGLLHGLNRAVADECAAFIRNATPQGSSPITSG